MKILGQKPLLGTPLNKKHPLARGLVACWLMNEGGGSVVNDLSGNGNTGVFGTGANAPTWTSGPLGNELYFPNDQYVVITGVTTGANYSIVMGIHTTSAAVDNIIDFESGRALIGIRNSGELSYYDTYVGWQYSGVTIGDDTLHQIAISHSPTAGQTYLDGQSIDTYAGSAMVLGGAARIGGKYSATVDDYTGHVSYTYIYNRALSASEIASLYSDPFQMFERDDLLLWSAAAGISVKDYTRGDVAALPADDTDLENAFTSGEYTQVEDDDADRVAQTATGEYAAFLFKDKHTGQESISVHWNGQTDRAPSDSTVYLQIYNRNTPGWETIASNNAAAANTDFDLQGQITENLAYYFDASFWIACRVYQEAV